MLVNNSENTKTSNGKVFVGEVVSDKMDKTVVVKITKVYRHQFYGKTLRRHKKFKVHDENNHAKNGDIVEIKECRPFSKEKSMLLIRILKKNEG